MEGAPAVVIVRLVVEGDLYTRPWWRGQKSSLVLTIPTIGMALLVYIEPVDQTTLLIRKRNEEDTE